MMASLNQRGSLVLAALFTRSSLSRGQRMQEAWVQLVAGAVDDEMQAGAAAFAGPRLRVVVQFDKRAFPRGLKPRQFTALIGAAEAAPFQSKCKRRLYRAAEP